MSQEGVYDRAVAALKLAKARGFRIAINATLFNNAEPERMARFFDDVTAMGVDAIMVSPGYAYERAPDQQHFLNRAQDQGAVPRHLRARQGQGLAASATRRCSSTSSPATRRYHCTPWGNPTRNVFGWQRPCYLLGEGYAKTLRRADGDHRLGHATAPATTRNAPTAWCTAATRRRRWWTP